MCGLYVGNKLNPVTPETNTTDSLTTSAPISTALVTHDWSSFSANTTSTTISEKFASEELTTAQTPSSQVNTEGQTSATAISSTAFICQAIDETDDYQKCLYEFKPLQVLCQELCSSSNVVCESACFASYGNDLKTCPCKVSSKI